MAEPQQSSKNSATSPEAQTVRSRLVLNFPGFEQTDSVAQLGRLRYGAEITGTHWGFEVSQDDLEHGEHDHHTLAHFKAKAENWQVETDLVQFRWNDIVHAYERSPFPAGFIRNSIKYFAFFFDGTVGKYRKASGRYWGFTIFPVLLFFIFGIIAAFLAGFLTSWLGLPFIAEKILSACVAIVIFLFFCKWPGDRLYLPLTIADWGFARDMVFRSNKEIEARFSEFAQTSLAQIKASRHDEIVIVGHSFGSLWAVVALGQALEKDPDLFAGKTIRFLALGSSMLKIALTPKAEFIRTYWKLMMNQREVFWHEIQTKDDLIAFYKCDPFEQVGIKTPKAEYAITRIRFSKGMEKKRYKAMRKSFYRTHRQYILYYDQRVSFDYKMRLFGPFDLESLARDETLLERIDQDGRLV